MSNDAEATETETPEIATPKINWTYTALGYLFVFAMGAMAVWVTPSPDPVSTQTSAADEMVSFIPFSGESGRVVLGRPAEDHRSEGADRSAHVDSPAPHTAPLAVAAYN